MKNTLKDGAGKNLLFESTIFTGRPSVFTKFIALFYRIDHFSVLPKNFCRKDPSTGVQKMIKCLACESQIEAVDTLKAHLKGQKHLKAFQV